MTTASVDASRPAMPGVMIAMTDLFISATATLLVILVLSQTERPVPLPIQADLIAICPTAADGAFLLVPASDVRAAHDAVIIPSLTDALDMKDAAGMSAVLSTMPGPPQLFYAIGLAGTVDRPVTPACLRRFQTGIVYQHNRAVSDGSAANRAIAGVQVLQRPIRVETADE